MIKKRLIFAVLLLVSLSIPLDSALGIPARRFIQMIPNQTINLNTDHFTVSMLQGHVTREGSRFREAFWRTSKLVSTVQVTINTFDGKTTTYTFIGENSDVGRVISRPWGVNRNIVERAPGDANVAITFNLLVSNEDIWKSVFDSIQANEALLPADLFAQPWLGYARAVSGIISSFLRTNQGLNPFSWADGGVLVGDVVGPNRQMPAHYIILIAPMDDRDAEINGLGASDVRYDEGERRLIVKGQPLLNRSFAVLKVGGDQGFNIPGMINGSQSPWAVLARTQYYQMETNSAQNRDQLAALARVAYNQLNNMADLLGNELRFSAHDRDLALGSFAAVARNRVSARCNDLRIRAAQCPISDLNRYVDDVARRVNQRVSDQRAEALFNAINQNAQQLMTQPRP